MEVRESTDESWRYRAADIRRCQLEWPFFLMLSGLQMWLFSALVDQPRLVSLRFTAAVDLKRLVGDSCLENTCVGMTEPLMSCWCISHRRVFFAAKLGVDCWPCFAEDDVGPMIWCTEDSCIQVHPDSTIKFTNSKNVISDL